VNQASLSGRARALGHTGGSFALRWVLSVGDLW
jgi:hypothetical protein